MHEVDLLVKPSLFAVLDTQGRISSKWIAHEGGRRHDNILRIIDTLEKEASSSVRRLNNGAIEVHRVFRDNGQLQECFVPLRVAVLILSRLDGEKAVMARFAILDGLHYLETVVPLLLKQVAQSQEAEAYWRNQVGSKAAKTSRAPRNTKVSAPQKRGNMPVVAPVLAVDMFDGPVFLWVDGATRDEIEYWQKCLMDLCMLILEMEGVKEAVDRKANESVLAFRERFKKTEVNATDEELKKMLVGATLDRVKMYREKRIAKLEKISRKQVGA